MKTTLSQISPELVQKYNEELGKSASASTLKRKNISLNKFLDWAKIKEEKTASTGETGAIVGTTGKSKSKKIGLRVVAMLGFTTGLIILIILLLGRLKFPIQFISNFAQESAIQTQHQLSSESGAGQTLPQNSISAIPAENGSWNLYARLKLSDSAGDPQVGSQSLTFKLYKSKSDTSPVWTSETENITTDSDGLTLISLDSVPTNLFWENERLFLGVDGVSVGGNYSVRIPVSTASVASNLGGYYPASPEGAEAETVPVINSDGALVLASQSPVIKATEGNFLIEGQAVTLKTTDGADGNIVINPDGSGIAQFLFEGTAKNFLTAQAPNLTTGSLYYGLVANNSTGYDFLKFQGGSTPATKFSVDALGNTFIDGKLTVDNNINLTGGGGLQVAGVTRLNSLGRLSSITGYYQDSGTFEIDQGVPDNAQITKTLSSATGASLADVLKLELDESTLTTGSGSDTLVLKRLGGTADAMALLVDDGNARFDGQVQLGRFASNPNAIGAGSLVFNTADSQVYVWNGSAWIAVGSGSALSFTDITSGTNTTAAMIVGSGASLTYSGTGTINASSVGSLTSDQFLRSDTSDNFTSGTLTTDAGTTFDINGDLTVSDTNVAFDGASTTFTTTGNLALTLGTGIIDISAQTTDVTLNSAADALNFDGNTLSIDALNNRVGIGTASPQGAFHLVGSTNIIERTGSDYGPAWQFRNDSAIRWIMQESPLGGDTGQLTFTDASTNRVLSLLQGGNVGIGTTAPDARLEINHATGDNLRLTYDDADGGATAYTDFSLASDGDLTIDSAGSNINLSDDLAVNADDLTTSQTTFNLVNTTATTLNIGGAATTALNIGNGNTAYTVINLGSGTGGNMINVAGTGATGADTVNIGTGGTGADTITIGNSSSTTTINLTKGATGNVVLTGYDCSVLSNGGVLTTDSSGNVICGNDDGGSGVLWSALTDPAGDLTLAMGAWNTTFNWVPTADTAETNFSLTTQGADAVAGGEVDQTLLSLSQVSNSIDTDQAADSLLTLANNDLNDPVVNAIRFDAGGAGTDFTYGINFDAADIGTAEIVLENGETISNQTDGTVAIGTSILSINAGGSIVPDAAGALTIGSASTTILNLTTDGTGNAEVVLPNDSVGPNELFTTGQTDEYCLTYETTGTTWEWQTCGSGGGSTWNALTDPAGDLTLTMGAWNTTFNWDPGDNSAETAFSLTFDGQDTAADEDQVLLALSQVANATDSVEAADALVTFANNDANDPVENAIRFDAGGAGTDFTYGINFDAASFGTAELILSNAATIGNITDGTLALTEPTIQLVGSTAIDIDSPLVDLGTQTIDVTLNNAADALNFDSNTLSIDALNNRIGIGDASPDQFLEILTSTAVNTQLSIGNTNAGTYDPQIGFELADGTNTFTMGVDDSDSDKFKISTTALGTNDRLTIDANGIVGINTTGTSGRLNVETTTQNTMAIVGQITDATPVGAGEQPVDKALRLVALSSDAITGDAIDNAQRSTYGIDIDAGDSGALTDGGQGAIKFVYGIYTESSDTGTHVATGALSESTVYGGYFSAAGKSANVTGITYGIYATATGGDNNYAGIFDAGSVGIGTITPDRGLEVLDASNPQLRLSQSDSTTYADFQIDSNGDLIVSVDGITNQLVLDNSGNVGVGTAGPDAKLDSSALSEQLRLTYTDSSVYAAFSVDGSGILAIDPTGSRTALDGSLQVGSPTSPQTYSRFGTAATGHSLSTADDLVIGSDLELNGVLYLDGANISNSAGTAALVLSSTPTTTANTLSSGNWLVENTANVGQAALIVNQTKAGDLFTASAGGVPKFTIFNNGDVSFGDNSGTDLTVGGGTGKINVGTVDPPYTINGKKFATYLSAMIGVKEETTGQVETSQYIPGVGYRFVIDFNLQPEGGDLWLFGKTTGIKENIDKLSVLLTSASPTNIWYEVDTENDRLIIYSARPTQISYRLTAPRFDSEKYANARGDDDSSVGFVIQDMDVAKVINELINIQNISDFVIEKVENTGYSLKNSVGEIIDGLQSAGNFIAGNIRAGALIAYEIAAPEIKTSVISPLADRSDIAVRLGSEAVPSGKLAIQNFEGEEVASIDSQGDATFEGLVNSDQLSVNSEATIAGTLYADDIKSESLDEIHELLSQVREDQDLLAQSDGWNINTATDSASLETLAVSDLYVTNQAAFNSLSLSQSLTVGSDLVISSIGNSLENGNWQIENSLNSLSAPLRIQSLAMAPVEIMAGLVTVDTLGNVQISGNLYVAGEITTEKGLKVQGPDSKDPLASIDASGSGVFANLTADKFVIAGSQATTSTTLLEGLVTETNSTIGSGIIPAGVSEITIKSPKITDYTLVYVTPTSETQNYVLYIKEKGQGYFKVGFNKTLDIDVSFNWWVIEVKQ